MGWCGVLHKGIIWICIALFFIVLAIIRVEDETVCKDSAGKPGKPLLGKGICVWFYRVRVLVFSDSNLFLWKTQYDGHWVDGKMHGYGTYTTLNGNKYTGHWKENKRHGTGEFRLTDGSLFKGDWVDDKLTCKDGVVVFSDLKNQIHHKIREELNSQQFLKGVQEYLSEGITYEGSMDNGQIHGTGTITISNIRKFTGTFNNGVLSSGIIILKDGETITLESSRDEWIVTSQIRVSVISLNDGSQIELNTVSQQPFRFEPSFSPNASDILQRHGLTPTQLEELKLTLSSLYFFEYYLHNRSLYLSQDIYSFSDDIKQLSPEDLSKYDL